ncbi:MAG: acyl carrier protein [Muribaculaceae bacterium]|nr:acyl carrier protein [Muribaculaceae bacterium]
MDIKEFTKKFSEVFDDADEMNLTPETYFKELAEYSSLTALSIIAFADENFDVTITGKEIRESETIQDLYDLINNK